MESYSPIIQVSNGVGIDSENNYRAISNEHKFSVLTRFDIIKGTWKCEPYLFLT